MSKGPVLIELETDVSPNVAEAEAVPDTHAELPSGQAMQLAAKLGARRGSRLGRWFWGLLVAFVGAVASVAAWGFLTQLVLRTPVLGWALTGLAVALALVAFVLIVKELAGFARLRRVDRLKAVMDAACADGTLGAASEAVDQLVRFYARRDDTAWGRQTLAERRGEVLDGDALLSIAETDLVVPLDLMALAEVEAAARQVAVVTALVPLALADLIAALTANMRMIRRVAEIYGGRSGTLGSWRLFRAVMTHLVATGAVAVGEDLIGPIAGGGALAKLSRRFGEGLVNGALTARVGVAAMEVCRPMAFGAGMRPSVTSVVKKALKGVFTKS